MRKILLFTTMILCLSFLAASCSGDDFSAEELGPASLEVTQDSLTFRFWLENEAGDVTNVFSKDEHFILLWSITNNQKTGRWVHLTSRNFNKFCSVYKDDEFIYKPTVIGDDLLRIRLFKPGETINGKRSMENFDSEYPHFKKGKYYTLVQAVIPYYRIETINGHNSPEYEDSIEFPELRINFGLK